MRSDAAKQPRKGAKESETSPRTEEELAGRKPVGGMGAATMAATFAALTSQCGGPLDPLWPPRIQSWVVPLLEFSCILGGFVLSLKALSNGRM